MREGWKGERILKEERKEEVDKQKLLQKDSLAGLEVRVR